MLAAPLKKTNEKKKKWTPSLLSALPKPQHIIIINDHYHHLKNHMQS